MAEQLFITCGFTKNGKADLEPLRKPVADAQAQGKTSVIVVGLGPMDYLKVLTASNSRGIIISNQGFVFAVDVAGRYRQLDIPDMRYEEALDNAAMATLIADITDVDPQPVLARLNQMIGHDPKVRSPIIVSCKVIDILKGHLASTALPPATIMRKPTWAEIAALKPAKAAKI